MQADRQEHRMAKPEPPGLELEWPRARHTRLDRRFQHRSNRTSISLEAGVTWQRLTAQPDHNVDFLLLRYPPGSESTRIP